MAQFDVHHNLDDVEASSFPYLLDVQSDLLQHLTTRLVVPLVLAATLDTPFLRLTPKFVIVGVSTVMLTTQMRAVPLIDLGETVTGLAERRFEVIAAIDFLISGV